ncbi:MAG: hypothetical protein B7Y95_02250 [Rhizobiales bacterium 32-66-11]|jgi:phenolic acid decarboxylase|nr:MAG: hypothetical protein B7Y95_02250 [Rhizobiales bacterium 32-66-11]
MSDAFESTHPAEIATFVGKHIIYTYADITFVEDCGRDDESVIACAPEDLPAGYATRRNVG